MILMLSVCAACVFVPACCLAADASVAGNKTDGKSPVSFVRCMMGTGADGRVIPVAAVPFGMVQLAPDTYYSGSGYHYSHSRILGFSHTHKSGGGGTDFQDIAFFPGAGNAWSNCKVYPEDVSSVFSHEQETATPGYYKVAYRQN